MRTLNNKGVVLVLLWTVLPFALSDSIIKTFAVPLIVIAVVSLPIVGCLSDVCFGRYNTICYSLWILWLSFIVINGYFIVNEYKEVEYKVAKWIIEFIIGGCAAVGLSGVMANTMLLLLIFAPTLAGTHG